MGFGFNDKCPYERRKGEETHREQAIRGQSQRLERCLCKPETVTGHQKPGERMQASSVRASRWDRHCWHLDSWLLFPELWKDTLLLMVICNSSPRKRIQVPLCSPVITWERKEPSCLCGITLWASREASLLKKSFPPLIIACAPKSTSLFWCTESTELCSCVHPQECSWQQLKKNFFCSSPAWLSTDDRQVHCV